MKDQVCTKQQMDELIALGVSIDSASMAERYDINGNFVEYVTSRSISCNIGFIIPVFTVVDMMNMIEEKLQWYDQIMLRRPLHSNWEVTYLSSESSNSSSKENSLKDSVFSVLLQLSKQK